MFNGFETIDLPLGGATIHARMGGAGEPLLLLHGYPQTHAMWHPIAAELAKSYRVIIADLRGYGTSLCHDGDFTFRAMAQDQVALMKHLGYPKFHLIAHDRGARTAHRMVLDHPENVLSVALLDILPTLDVWRIMDAALAKSYYHWLFLSQPSQMPRQLIASNPILFLHTALVGLSGHLELFGKEALADYEQAAQKPSVIDAWCGDYTAGANLDLEHDRQDQGRISTIPTLILWGSKGVVANHMDPLEAWAKWFSNVSGHAIQSGHFLVEERPFDVLTALTEHLSATDSTGS